MNKNPKEVPCAKEKTEQWHRYAGQEKLPIVRIDGYVFNCIPHPEHDDLGFSRQYIYKHHGYNNKNCPVCEQHFSMTVICPKSECLDDLFGRNIRLNNIWNDKTL